MRTARTLWELWTDRAYMAQASNARSLPSLLKGLRFVYSCTTIHIFRASRVPFFNTRRLQKQHDYGTNMTKGTGGPRSAIVCGIFRVEVNIESRYCNSRFYGSLVPIANEQSSIHPARLHPHHHPLCGQPKTSSSSWLSPGSLQPCVCVSIAGYLGPDGLLLPRVPRMRVRRTGRTIVRTRATGGEWAGSPRRTCRCRPPQRCCPWACPSRLRKRW